MILCYQILLKKIFLIKYIVKTPENKNELETILKEKINELGQYLMDNCENETKKKEIHDSLYDLPLYKLYMFIYWWE